MINIIADILFRIRIRNGYAVRLSRDYTDDYLPCEEIIYLENHNVLHEYIPDAYRIYFSRKNDAVMYIIAFGGIYDKNSPFIMREFTRMYGP